MDLQQLRDSLLSTSEESFQHLVEIYVTKHVALIVLCKPDWVGGAEDFYVKYNTFFLQEKKNEKGLCMYHVLHIAVLCKHKSWLMNIN